MFLPCYIFFTHFEFAAKFIYRCISPDISSVFSMCTKQLNIGEEFRAEQKFSYYFIIVFIFRYWKLGGFHVTILIEEQPLYHTFSSPPLQRRRKCTRAKSSKTLPLVMILCLALSCAIQSTANRFGKQYWILRFRALSTHKTRKRSIFLSMPKASD